MPSLARSIFASALIAATSAVNTNVLNGQDFADPGLLQVNGVSYSYSTASNKGSIPKTSNSDDFNNPSAWASPEESFPQDSPAQSSGGWAKPGTSWAPDVVQLTDYDDSFAMYYASEINGDGTQPHCLGLARNLDDPNGPFTDGSTSSFICPSSQGGAIDPEAFLDDDNQRYVAYKIDGPFGGQGPCSGTQGDTPIMLQPLQSDGYTFDGDVIEIWNATASGTLGIEAPSLVKVNGIYFLFYAVGCYAGNDYRTDYVTASSVRGPYGNPRTVLQTGDFGLFGPGGLDVVPGSLQATFHSLIASGDVSKGRQMNTCQLSFDGETVTVS